MLWGHGCVIEFVDKMLDVLNYLIIGSNISVAGVLYVNIYIYSAFWVLKVRPHLTIIMSLSS